MTFDFLSYLLGVFAGIASTLMGIYCTRRELWSEDEL